MIVLLLLIAAVIITFLDISHYWLDDETKNILYFNTNNSSSNEDTSDSDTPDASESEVGSESDSEDNKTSDSSDQESSFEDQILEELNQEMKNHQPILQHPQYLQMQLIIQMQSHYLI